MNKAVGWSVLGVVAVSVGAYFYLQREPAKLPEAPAELAVPNDDLEAIEHPIPEGDSGDAAANQPLPSLEDSDARIREELTTAVGADDALMKMLVPEKIIRRIVASVDGLARKKLAVQMRPVQPLTGQLVVVGDPNNEETV